MKIKLIIAGLVLISGSVAQCMDNDQFVEPLANNEFIASLEDKMKNLNTQDERQTFIQSHSADLLKRELGLGVDVKDLKHEGLWETYCRFTD